MQPTLFEKPKKLTQTDKILEALRQAGEAGVSNFELNRDICFAYSQRIGELKRRGYNISSKHIKGSQWLFILEEG